MGRCSHPSEFQTPTHKKHFALRAVVVPPAGINSGRQQAHHRCAALFGASVCLFNPCGNLSTIWRVHPAHPTPVLCQSVIIRRKESIALGIFWQGAHVLFKPKNTVQAVKEILRRCPHISLARKHQFFIHRVSFKNPPNSSLQRTLRAAEFRRYAPSGTATVLAAVSLAGSRCKCASPALQLPSKAHPLAAFVAA